MTITYDDFLKVDVRVGAVVSAEEFVGARQPAIKMQIDFGPELGIKKTSAQVTAYYKPEELIGRQVCAVVNFPPKQIGNFMSEVLVLGFSKEDKKIVLIAPDQEVPNGVRMH
ncbi:MAG: tRNA-binding protein [Alphaproteobacteria bacterium]|nr:tRNA-binding protein [Alphaproteobacteria bacterium]